MTSDQAFSESQGLLSGFLGGLSMMLVPPVITNLKEDCSSLPLKIKSLEVKSMEKTILSFSNRDLQMLAYREYTK